VLTYADVNGDTLVQTAGLALVMIYLFGVVGFILFPELFQFTEADIDGGRKLEVLSLLALLVQKYKY
jgi:hypothetical protein